MPPTPDVVFVDADDTLWENYRYFQEVVRDWVRFMEGAGVDGLRALEVLEECEDRNIPTTGYGAGPFVLSLRDAFRCLLPHPDPSCAALFDDLAHAAERDIRDHEILLLPGVREGLEALADACPVVVLTKGQEDEQLAKVERSGLGHVLDGVMVVPEKRPDTFTQACAAHGARPSDAWMVGNSPASDVNPARLAGLHTVLVPHAAPWHRELASLVRQGFPTLEARTFADVPRLVLGESMSD